MGCSTAYHLAKLWPGDVLLLERAALTSGSTFHAAGLVGQLRGSAGVTRLLGESVALYERLEAETGLATGWKMNGGLRLACSTERMAEFEREATTAASFGLGLELLTPNDAGDMWPLMQTDDLVGAAFLPTDGSANPSDLTHALARGARTHGARIIEDCPVSGVDIEAGRVTGVFTPRGHIACEVVVNCCGQWARGFGRIAGVNVPLVSVEHQFLITEPIEGVTGDMPTLRDPDRLTYFKEEVGGLVVGGYEPDPVLWSAAAIADGFHFGLLEPDVDRFQQLAESAFRRVPAIQNAGVRHMTNGPESFTPDGNFILGEAPEVVNYFVGAGFNAFGIAAAGGAGWALAAWIVDGEAPFDLWPVDIRRFGPPHQDAGWVRSRTLEMYRKHYDISWPSEEYQSGRPLRRSPLYDRLATAGACFGEKFGWERPNWFAPEGVAAQDSYSFGRPNWFPFVGDEHRAVRERVAVFDQTSFAKFELVGSDAEQALSWLCANDITKSPGRITYTQMLNRRGGIECDVTVTRLSDDRFYLVTGTGFATHDANWIERNLPVGVDARLHELTTSLSVLALMGPASRQVLAAVTSSDVSNEAFAFGTLLSLEVAGALVWALRVSYVGELGFELHVPVESAIDVYEALMAAGAPHRIRDAGYRAIDSLRLEKGYRAWAADVTPDDTPLEAGLGWAVKLGTEVPFLGRKALEHQMRSGTNRRLAGFTVDDLDVVLLGGERVFRNDEPVGWLTSGGWGYTIERGIGYGYVNNEDGVDAAYLRSGTYELEVATRRVPVALHLRPLYDPAMERVKG
jgi:4-methylaminobutanoate oxidase (formaldehyde-forming)